MTTTVHLERRRERISQPATSSVELCESAVGRAPPSRPSPLEGEGAFFDISVKCAILDLHSCLSACMRKYAATPAATRPAAAPDSDRPRALPAHRRELSLWGIASNP